jgi:hypothetical protein
VILAKHEDEIVLAKQFTAKWMTHKLKRTRPHIGKYLV